VKTQQIDEQPAVQQLQADLRTLQDALNAIVTAAREADGATVDDPDYHSAFEALLHAISIATGSVG
jgi:hypothetical protein